MTTNSMKVRKLDDGYTSITRVNHADQKPLSTSSTLPFSLRMLKKREGAAEIERVREHASEKKGESGRE